MYKEVIPNIYMYMDKPSYHWSGLKIRFESFYGLYCKYLEKKDVSNLISGLNLPWQVLHAIKRHFPHRENFPWEQFVKAHRFVSFINNFKERKLTKKITNIIIIFFAAKWCMQSGVRKKNAGKKLRGKISSDIFTDKDEINI